MRRIWCVLFAVILACSLALVCSAEETEAYTYTASNGVSFTVPDGWSEFLKVDDPVDGRVQFVCDQNPMLTIVYVYGDLYRAEGAEHFDGKDPREFRSREELDNAVVGAKAMEELLNWEEQESSVAVYGGRVYYCKTELETSGETPIPITYMARVENGYLHMFAMSVEQDDPQLQHLQDMLSGASYSGMESLPNFSNEGVRNREQMYLLIVCLMIGLYSLPIIVYRYCIRRKPVPAKNAGRIVVIYGLCLFFPMCIVLSEIVSVVIAGSALVLWSCINYHMLTK